MRTSITILVSATVPLLLACGASDDSAESLFSTANARQALLVGDDDRLDWYEVEDATLRDRLAETTAALIYPHRLNLGGDVPVLVAPTLSEAQHLCEGERFSDQPSAASCAGNLVDRDLVLTAGHCLGTDLGGARERCARLRFLFGYRMEAPGTLAPLNLSDVYSCRRVALHRVDSESGQDFAVIELDRPVPTEHAVALIADRAPQVGDLLILAGYGAGLPLKIELGSDVTLVPTEDSFIANTDSFAGGSGSGTYDAGGRLVGIQMDGQPDWRLENGCAQPAVVATSNERHQSATRAVRALCDEGWPSQALCGTPSVCGDTICNADERGHCDADCLPARCGDHVCDPSEYRECEVDCPSYSDVPASFASDPAIYRAAVNGGVADPTGLSSRSASSCALAGGRTSRDGAWFLIAAVIVVIARQLRRYDGVAAPGACAAARSVSPSCAPDP